MDKQSFPKELAALPNWVCWRLEKDKKSGRDTKVPYSPISGYKASASNPDTWGILDEAVYNREKYLFSGIGFVFTAECGIIGIDIDHCLADGKPNDVAAAILERMPTTYIEVSPSGIGLHIFLRGVAPSGGNRNSKSGVEMYSKSRYFTMTGVRWRDCADTIADDNGVIEWVHQTFVAPLKRRGRGNATTTVSIADDELLKLANSSKDGMAFGKLYAGEWSEKYKSQSEADFALCCKLAFWSGRNEAQIDRLFRKSGLYREKWDASHSADGSTYGAQTVRNACTNTDKTYTPPRKHDVSEIFEERGSYWRNKNQRVYQLTNFIIKPIEMIVADDESQLTCDLITVKGECYRQAFKSNDFANLQRLKNELTRRTIALSFFGGEGDLELFKQFVDNLGWTKKKGVKALGIYPHGRRLVFVDTNGAIGSGGKRVNDIVQLERYKRLESDILTAPLIDKTGLQLLGQHIFSYNMPSRTVPILTWVAGCFIKPHLRRAGIKFPHLFLVGEPGSGKSSSLERIILPAFGKSKATASSQTKPFTLMKDSNSSNIIPQCFEEFKPSKLPKQILHSLYNHFRDAYDWHEGIRGRADQSQVVYDLLAPICVAGEESSDETAIRERTVELLFSKKDLKQKEHRAAFEWVIENAGVVRSFGRSLLDTALCTSPKEVSEWYSEGKEYFAKGLNDRILNNLCAMYAGISLINKLCQSLGMSFKEVFPLDHAACAANLEYAAREYLLDDSSYNKGAVEQAFEVMARMKLKAGEDYAFENNGQYLCIHLHSVYDRYTRYRRDYAIIGEVLPYEQFRKQLEHAEFFISKNRNKRFGETCKKVWTVNFHVLDKLCDVSGFQREAPKSDNE